MIDARFVGLNQNALDFLSFTGRPARRKVVIEYEDGTTKIVSDHKFIEITFETRRSNSSNHLPLIAYYSGSELLYEERIQCEHADTIFTALWDVQKKAWVDLTLWNDAEIQEYL